MGTYKFEAVMAVCDVFDIEADSYHEAEALAREEAEFYYPVAPQGFALSWDNIDIVCIDEPDEEEE
jgi:hypothetical protein